MNKRTVLFVPGTLMSATSFDAVQRCPTLQGSNVVYENVEWMRDVPMCDIPKAAEHLAARIRRVKSPAVLVGHSTGGCIAAFTAIHYPELVSGLVLLNSGPNMTGHGAVEQILTVLEGTQSPETWEMLASKNVSEGSPRRWIDEMIEFSETIGPRSASTILQSQAEIDLLSHCNSSTVGVEILHGILDEKRSPDDAERWLAVFPRASIRYIDDCGHSPQLEAPSAVANAISNLVAAC